MHNVYKVFGIFLGLVWRDRMDILVTGGAGFLGSHLCKYLLEKNKQNNVVCVDNLYTGNKQNVAELIKDYPQRFEFLRHDIVQPLFIEVDQIYNLACPASPVHYQGRHAIKTIKTSTMGMINMLGLAKRCDARLMQASTSEVYGDPEQHPQKEEYFGNVNCLGPRSCYDEGKRVAESLCINYHIINKVPVRIARIFNTYGPNMSKDDGRVVSNFIMQALQNKDITVYGDGKQTRSFCFVSDLIEGFYKLMNSDHIGPFNLGNPTENTILELAEKIIQLTGSSSEIIYEDLPKDDPTRRNPDISKAKNILKWEPKVGLNDGLRETIIYFKKRFC